MCARKYAVFLAFLVLSSLLPPLGSCEVVLTDEEARAVMTELKESRKDLEDVTELSEGLRRELETLKEESERQRTYYERQLRGRALTFSVAVAATAACCLAGGIVIGRVTAR